MSTAVTVDPVPVVTPTSAGAAAAGEKKEVVSLEDLWRHSVEFAKRLGKAGGNFLAFILRMIRAVCNRICALCGAEFRMSEQGVDGEVGPEQAPAVHLSGPGAADAAKLIKGAAELQVENFVALAPALDRLKDKEGGEFFKAAIDSLLARQDELKKSHAELVQANEPLMRAVCESLQVTSYEDAYEVLAAGLVSGPPIDPNGEFRALYVKMTAIEDEIKKVDGALRGYLVAALELDELRPAALDYFNSDRLSDIRKTLQNDHFSQMATNSGGEYIARGIESRNNFGTGGKVVDLSAASLSKNKARELPAELSPGVPRAETAPLGMSRFAGVNKLKVGDMSDMDEVPEADAQSGNNSPKA